MLSKYYIQLVLVAVILVGSHATSLFLIKSDLPSLQKHKAKNGLVNLDKALQLRGGANLGPIDSKVYAYLSVAG